MSKNEKFDWKYCSSSIKWDSNDNRWKAVYKRIDMTNDDKEVMDMRMIANIFFILTTLSY